MPDRIKNTISISQETDEKIKKLGELTHRPYSHVIDWLVADAWDRMEELRRGQVALETVIEPSC
jgi:hypothetical protein